MTNIKSRAISLAVISALSMGFSGCDSSSNNDPQDPPPGGGTTKSYNGAGSRWELSFKSDKTAIIKERDSNLEINATYENLSSGFKKITVVSSSDTSKANVGDVTYGFELPDYMFPFVAFNENKLLPTVINNGECPNTVEHNCIVSFAKSNTQSDGSAGSFDSWGTFGHYEYDTDQNYTHVSVFDRNGNSTNNMSFDGSITSGCVNGKYYDPNGDPTDPERASTTAYFSKNGGIIWQQNGLDANYQSGYNHHDRIENDFMIPKEPNLNSISQIDGTYIGYVISGNGHSSINYSNTPVNVTADNGVLTITEVTNLTDGTLGTSSIGTITLNTEVNGTKGLWRGNIQTSQGTEGIGCAIDLNAGGSNKNIIICGGMNPDGTLKSLYSAILVSK